MHRYLKKLVDERNALTGLMQQLTDRAVADDRELSEAEAQRMRDWQERAAHLDGDITEQSDYLESQRSWARLVERVSEPDPAGHDAGRGGELVAAGGGGVATREATSWGEMFVRSAAFADYSGRGSSDVVELPGVFETRAAITTQYMETEPYRFTPTPWNMTTPLLDAVTRERVSNGTVEWVVWPGAYPEAAVVAENALKPEADFAPTPKTASLNTYAHWKGITRQALEDLPRIQSIVETYLRQGILRKLEADAATALSGDTVIPSLTTDDLLAGIRTGIGNVQQFGYASPNVVMLNPSDFAALDVSVMLGSHSAPSVNSSFWGVRAIAVGAIPSGTAYVGDFKAGVTIFDRAQTAVYMTDSHADNFVRNVLVILAEARALPIVTDPYALQKIVVDDSAAPPAESA